MTLMTLRVLINGYAGKMGQECVKAIQNYPTFSLVGTTGHQDDLVQTIRDTQAQIVIDFTNSESGFKNTQLIIEAGAHPVVGTTGFLPHHIQTIRQLCESKRCGAVIAPNFSIGAILMMRFAQQAAQYFSEVEIIEQHHEHKKDSPSGTALKTAELIAQTRRQVKRRKDQEVLAGTRGGVHEGVTIHAIRLPGRLAEQEVLFGGPGEVLSIQHETTDRKAFMPGVILACQKVMSLPGLVYGLEELLD